MLDGGWILTASLWNFGHTDKLPRTGSVARPLTSDAICSPLGVLLVLLFLAGTLKGRGPS